MSIEDFLAMCDRVMSQAAQNNPDALCLQNVFMRRTGEPDRNRSLIPSCAKPTILVVENEPVLLDALRETLQQSGYTVLTAPSGESAIRICRQHDATIDVLLSDVAMGQVDGFQVAATVRSVFPNVIVLLMSGTPIACFPENSVPDQFLEKPFSRQKLLAAIARHATIPVRAEG